MTYPNGFGALDGSASQVWQLPVLKSTGGYPDYTANYQGDICNNKQWTTGASDGIPLTHGAITVWYNPDADKVYDCAHGACTLQPHPCPNGHWGTPYRIYKLGGSFGDVIRAGDTVYFDRMMNSYFDTGKSLQCNTGGCSGTNMGAHGQDDPTLFVIGVPSGGSADQYTSVESGIAPSHPVCREYRMVTYTGAWCRGANCTECAIQSDIHRSPTLRSRQWAMEWRASYNQL